MGIGQYALSYILRIGGRTSPLELPGSSTSQHQHPVGVAGSPVRQGRLETRLAGYGESCACCVVSSFAAANSYSRLGR